MWEESYNMAVCFDATLLHHGLDLEKVSWQRMASPFPYYTVIYTAIKDAPFLLECFYNVGFYYAQKFGNQEQIDCISTTKIGFYGLVRN